jgi:hypothetical protein
MRWNDGDDSSLVGWDGLQWNPSIVAVGILVLGIATLHPAYVTSSVNSPSSFRWNDAGGGKGIRQKFQT